MTAFVIATQRVGLLRSCDQRPIWTLGNTGAAYRGQMTGTC